MQSVRRPRSVLCPRPAPSSPSHSANPLMSCVCSPHLRNDPGFPNAQRPAVRMPLPLSDGAGLGCRQGVTPRPASAGLGHKASHQDCGLACSPAVEEGVAGVSRWIGAEGFSLKRPGHLTARG